MTQLDAMCARAEVGGPFRVVRSFTACYLVCEVILNHESAPEPLYIGD
jgi:hypothetical protein